ncbi:MAG: type I DNA topoisomerase [Muribaculaceae bacterium]|jgi:DNA topoisomerase-1|nr:type I DNA topoisomerase [Muribaculaceae bacterium]
MSTPKNLVIVESPAKAKTIEKFLGSDYRVMSSYGHIRDLKKKKFSIDVENGFAPIYEIPEDKTQLVSDLKRAAAGAQTVWLASDEDREGEAIAWHLYEVLGLKPENTRRIVFHEITKKAILNAIANPRDIDLARVDAQQARRVLDRIVGFELSPVLWKRLKPALSAGRVQSVAVRLIVEREKEIQAFVSEPYFRVSGLFGVNGAQTPMRAELGRRLGTAAEAEALLKECAGAKFAIGAISVKPIKKSPAPPFTTSTLQQEAARKLGFSVSQTMMVAQHLYESGRITYMRTDSLNLSDEAVAAISSQIESTHGREYLHVRKYHTNSKGAQEAHEAIRPTYVDVAELADATAQEQKLYALIRRRAIASQMADAEIKKTTAEIESDSVSYPFTATGEVVEFDGFLKVYAEGHDDDSLEDDDSPMLPKLSSGDVVVLESAEAIERFTQHPPRYTEASLVKKMEELGIGRPSTYAPTISTIQQRGYVERGEHEGSQRDYTIIALGSDGKISKETRSQNSGSDKGKLVPTDIGMIVNDFLSEYFPSILDYNFTANVEERFDEIAHGTLPWTEEIGDFYKDFHPAIDQALTISQGPKFGERMLGKDPATGEPVSVKIGRFGPVVQIGDADAEVKPRFASLLKDQSMGTITLEEALKLFEFPRQLGDFEGKAVSVGVGRFGPYVRHDGKYVSIPKDIQAAEVTLEQAVELIEAKRVSDAQKTLLVYEENPDMQILNGRFGPYISYNKKNYKLPRGLENPATLPYEEALKIVEAADAAPAKAKRGTVKKKK